VLDLFGAGQMLRIEELQGWAAGDKLVQYTSHLISAE